MRYIPGLIVALAVAVLGLASVSDTTAAGAETWTEHSHQETVVFYDYVPCHEELGAYRITAVVNSVFHGTEKGETGHFTGGEGGTFVAEPVVAVLVYDPDEDENTPVPADPPVDPSRPTYEGRYQSHGGFNANQNNESGFSKLSVRGTGSDGSSFAAHNLFHGSLSATGVENAFERLNCR